MSATKPMLVKAKSAVRKELKKQGLPRKGINSYMGVGRHLLTLGMVKGHKWPTSKKEGKQVVSDFAGAKQKAARTNGAAFLESWEWRTLRYKVLQQYGRRCMCCGATPDDGKTAIHVDHIKPRHTHPELALERDNLQVLCGECNQGKGAWDTTDFRA